MSKFVQILFIASCVFALCQAEAPRNRAARFNIARRNRFLARQEVEEPAAVTPYPTADELKPEVPFEEAIDSAPIDLPNQPDEVYGPPEVEAEEESLGADQDQGEEQVPSDVAENEVPAEEELPEEATAEPQAERLIFGRRIAGRRAARPAKLRAAPKAVRLQRQQQFAAQPVFVYLH